MTTSTKDDRERALDERIAVEVMGETNLCNHKKYTDDTGAFCAESCEGFIVPPYSRDIACAFQVEDRIAELKRTFSYSEALHEIVTSDEAEQGHCMTSFALIHATPRQRCEAALAALSTVKEQAG